MRFQMRVRRLIRLYDTFLICQLIRYVVVGAKGSGIAHNVDFLSTSSVFGILSGSIRGPRGPPRPLEFNDSRLHEPQRPSSSMPSVELASKRQAARDVIDILSEISLLLACLSSPCPRSPELIPWATEHTSGPQHTVSLRIPDREWCQP